MKLSKEAEDRVILELTRQALEAGVRPQVFYEIAENLRLIDTLVTTGFREFKRAPSDEYRAAFVKNLLDRD